MSTIKTDLQLKYPPNAVYTNDQWYYANKISALKDLSKVSIVLTDAQGNETFNLDLSPACIEVLETFLQNLKAGQ